MTETTGLGRALLRSKPAQLGEIVVLFNPAYHPDGQGP